MKNLDFKHITILAFVILVGALFRLANLDKPYGLWLDEMISYNQTYGKSLMSILNYSFTVDIHAPLYYLLLNLWMRIFGDADVILRLFSVIPGILTVVWLYLLGKEVDTKETGLLAAFLAGISSFLIHYSQEVRLYSMTAFLAVLAVYFAVRTVKTALKADLASFMLTNVLLMYTHTIGFIFVFFEVLFFGWYIVRERKEQLKNFVLASVMMFTLFLPYLFSIWRQATYPTEGVLSQWWCKINLSKIAFSVGDFFSPLIMNVYGLDLNYVNFLFSQQDGINFSYIQYSIVPALVMITGLMFAIKAKNRYINLILLLCGGFFAAFTAIYFKGKIIFITRYIIEIAPFLILAAAYGLLKIKDKRFSYSLIAVYITLTLVCMVGFSISGFNDDRVSGHKTPINIIKQHNLDGQSEIISMYYDTNYFTKYYPKGQGAIFNDINMQNFRNFFPEGKALTRNFTKEKFYARLKPFIAGENTAFFENKVKKEYIDPLPKGKYFVILTDNRFHCFKDSYLKTLTDDDAKYQHTEMPLMLFSRFNEAFLKLCDRELKLVEKRQEKRWELYFYKKP